MKIALIGNPNSGKTTLFNSITGKQEQVGNWGGVTIEKKEAKLKSSLNPNKEDVKIVDLPGTYSINPYTNEESVTKEFIIETQPDVIINIVDSTYLNRSLFFTTQLLELGIPIIVALNKIDLAEKKGNKINIRELINLMGCMVVAVSATKETGLEYLIEKAIKAAGKPQKNVFEHLLYNRHEHHMGESVHGNHHKYSMQRHIDKKRFAIVNDIVEQVEKKKISAETQTKQDAVDRIIAHKWLGIPIFVAVIWLVFSISQSWVGPWLADILSKGIDFIYITVESWMGDAINPVLAGLLLDSIIGGVGAVVGFLPLIMVLFFLLALLEDCGYMARVAVIMDRFFKKVGLSGRSIIPLVTGTGCAVPGVMATRTIKNERQRRTTAMLTPFMPCGAKLPVIALFTGVFFSGKAWVGTSMYFLGIVVIIIGALIVRSITGDKSKSYFLIEIPEYRFPSIKRAFLSMLDRAKAFLIKAGTIILVCNAVIQIMQTFTWSFDIAESGAESILGTIAQPIAVLFIPLGFGLWQFAAASISGIIAKENLVATLAVCFSISNFIDPEEFALVGGANEVSAIMGIGAVAALAYLVFNLFTIPCVAAVGSLRAELKSNKWFWGTIGFQLSVGYILAFLVYQIGTLITQGTVGDGFAAGLIAVSGMCSIIGYLMYRGRKAE